MKKLVSGFLSIALTLGLLILSFGAPANASVPTPDKITYCQATGNGDYHEITAATKSLVDKQGVIKQGGINANDIVPPFRWDFGGDNHGDFAGYNYSTTNANFLTVNHCNPVLERLILPGWKVTDYTCTLAGNAVLTNPDTRLKVTGPTVTGKTVSASFSLPDNTQYFIYTWDDRTVADKTLSHTMTDPITDALWDTSTNSCRTPDTGAGIKSEHIVWAGGLIFAGLLLTTISGAMRRRKK